MPLSVMTVLTLMKMVFDLLLTKTVVPSLAGVTFLEVDIYADAGNCVTIHVFLLKETAYQKLKSQIAKAFRNSSNGKIYLKKIFIFNKRWISLPYFYLSHIFPPSHYSECS